MACTPSSRDASAAIAPNSSTGSAPWATSSATRRNAPCCSASARRSKALESGRVSAGIADQPDDRGGTECPLVEEAGCAAVLDQLGQFVSCPDRDQDHLAAGPVGG